MNGQNRVVLDTNAVIALLAGNQSLATLASEAEWIGISIITMIEFLATPLLQPEDQRLFESFAQRVQVVDLSVATPMLVDEVVRVRRLRTLKLPDAIVAATAVAMNASLVTTDAQIARSGVVDIVNF